jgi:hypothetical protein
MASARRRRCERWPSRPTRAVTTAGGGPPDGSVGDGAVNGRRQDVSSLLALGTSWAMYIIGNSMSASTSRTSAAFSAYAFIRTISFITTNSAASVSQPPVRLACAAWAATIASARAVSKSVPRRAIPDKSSFVLLEIDEPRTEVAFLKGLTNNGYHQGKADLDRYRRPWILSGRLR